MKNMNKSISFSGLVAVFLSAPKVIFACSSCDTLSKFSQAKIDAYYATVLFLGGLPLFLGAILVYIVYKSARKKTTEE
jgi:hypothetical protein